MTEAAGPSREEAESATWRTAYAQVWAETILRVLNTPYPYGSARVSLGPDDNDVTPERLHPAFHDSVDWHSSAHMQWSAIRLLTSATHHLREQTRAEHVAVLDARLTEAHGRREADYLRERPSYERPYGWGWAAMLGAAASQCPLPRARTWAAATRPVVDAVADLVLDWMPRLAYPCATACTRTPHSG